MFSKLKSILIELGSLGPVLAFAVLAPGLGILVLTVTHENWLPDLRELNLQNFIVFTGSAVILAGLSLVPTHAVSLIAGMLYGVYYGPLAAILCILMASILSFLVTDKIVGDKATQALIKRPQAKSVFDELLRHKFQRTVTIISLVRLSPIMPFAGTNVLLAAAKVKMSEFLLGSAIGLAPRIILVAVAGAGLSQLDLKQKSSSELLILGIVATLITLIVIGKFAKKALSKYIKTEKTEAS